MQTKLIYVFREEQQNLSHRPSSRISNTQTFAWPDSPFAVVWLNVVNIGRRLIHDRDDHDDANPKTKQRQPRKDQIYPTQGRGNYWYQNTRRREREEARRKPST